MIWFHRYSRSTPALIFISPSNRAEKASWNCSESQLNFFPHELAAINVFFNNHVSSHLKQRISSHLFTWPKPIKRKECGRHEETSKANKQSMKPSRKEQCSVMRQMRGHDRHSHSGHARPSFYLDSLFYRFWRRPLHITKLKYTVKNLPLNGFRPRRTLLQSFRRLWWWEEH